MTDYEKTYDEFWKPIIENADGTLNVDQIKRELFDAYVVMTEVGKAYDDVTGGRLSKPNTAAHHVVASVDERIEEAVREALVEAFREFADLIDRGPAIPLRPSIFSALAREKADAIEAGR